MSATMRVFLLAWLCFTVLSSLWSLSTPLSAAPDEPAHLVKAASVARGELIGEPSDAGHLVEVPETIAFSHALTCFAFDSRESAACAPKLPSTDELVTASTTAGLYNPLYYALVGWPSLVVGGADAIYAMRIASAALTAALFAMSAMLVSTWRSRLVPTMGLLVATTPLAIFIGGVVNPSGPEIAGTLTVAVATYSLIRHSDERYTKHRIVVLAIAASVVMNMRGISPLWIALAVLLPLTLIRRRELLELVRHPLVRTAATLTAMAGACAVLWTLFTNSLGSAIENGAVETDYPGAGTDPLTGFFTVVSRTVLYGRGMVAEFGWADTVASEPALFVLATLIGATLIAGLVILRGREFAVFVAALASVIFLPALIQASYVTQGGYIWQGRYTAPMFGVLLFLTLAMVNDSVKEHTRSRTASRLFVLVIALWSLTQLDTFIQVLGRYSVGTPVAWREFLRTPEWQPPGGIFLLCTAAVAVIAALSGLAWLLGRGQSKVAAARLRFDDDLIAAK